MSKPQPPSAVEGSDGGPTTAFAYFPDEILDEIIGDVGPFVERLEEQNWNGKSSEKADWFACSQVCHRWRNITLPHLFRRISLEPVNTKGTETAGDHGIKDDAAAFLSFIQKNPEIAKLIHEISFVTMIMSNPSFVTVLKALPNLRFLALCASQILAHTAQPRFKDDALMTIDKLLWEDSIWTSPKGDITMVVPLFGYFSRIGELAVGQHEEDMSALDQVFERCLERLPLLRIDKLNMVRRGFPFTCSRYFPVFTILRNLQAPLMSAVTRLSLACHNDETIEALGNRLLLDLGATLLELDLRLLLSWDVNDLAEAWRDKVPSARESRLVSVLTGT